VGLIEETFSIMKDRHRTQPGVPTPKWGRFTSSRGVPECRGAFSSRQMLELWTFWSH